MTSKDFYRILFLIMMMAPITLRAQNDVIAPSATGFGTFKGETPPLRDLPVITEAEWQKYIEKAEEKIRNPKIRTRSYPYAETALPKSPDQLWQREMGINNDTRAPIQNFNGSDSPGFPSDANGTIGPEHYMQTINTFYTIFNRAGTIVAGPTALNTLFYGVAGSDNNDGDPIILYDEQADRWLVAEFSIFDADDSMLVAVSTTNDPTGTWYKYSFNVSETPDYEKFGIWRDGYYMGTNTSGAGQNDIYVFNRSNMLNGQSAQFVGFDNPWRPTTWDGFMCVPPLDNDGPFAPEGEPGLFITINDDAISGGNDELWIYELDVDWVTPANSTFSRTQQIAITAFDSNFGTNLNNIKQLNTGTELDAIPQVIMNPPQYRNFGSYETIVCCHTVDVDNTDHAGIRWYELRRVSSGNWTVRQSGTYAPDAHSRWLGSIMLNGSGEIGLGYSISSSTLYPGIRYCGQSSTAYTSASGTLDVAEQLIVSGDTCQQTMNRWGDYSGMQVDPEDDETFWFTNQYIDYVSPSLKRKTKIASFQIGTPVLRANFAANTVYPQKYSTVSFSDVSSGSPTSWYWTITPAMFNFTGGTSATSQDPKVQFTGAGDFTVTLTITYSGNSDSEIKTGYIHVSDCGNLYLPFTEDFSEQELPACWQNIDNVGYGLKWIFHHPGQFNIHTTTDENGFAILDSYHHGDTLQNADLITPTLDLSAYTTVNLKFIYFYPYYGPDPYAAYGKLFYSINDGLTWSLLQTWSSSADSSVYSQNITQVAGQSKVRFKWNYTGHGYFWAIDDLSITGTGPHVWTGATSNNWATTSNWSTGTVPAATSNVIIPASAPNWPVYTGNFIIGSQCDTLTLYGSSQLTITGNLTINPGKLIEVKGNAQIHVGGNWNNNGFFVPGSGLVHFTGSSTSSVNPVSNNITNYIRTTFRKGMTEISGGTTGPQGNDEAVNATIPFSFNYLGTGYNQVRICSNGWMSFTISTLVNNQNQRLFNTQTPNMLLAPWWDDLIDDGTSVISYKTEGSTPNRVFIVEWDSVPVYNGVINPARISFQAKLYETTNIIEFHYGELVYGAHSASESASIGIKDATGGANHYIDATTGSTTTGISTLKSTLNWPAVNYRFYPPTSMQTFHDLTAEKTANSVTLLINTSVNGNLTISGGTLSGPNITNGILEVKGNLSNNGTYTPGSSTCILKGTTNQDIGGNSTTTFNNLIINNAIGISLQNNESVSGTLTMSSGNINCGAYVLTLGTSSSATGTLSYTAGNILGSFKRWIAASTLAAINFPVGTTSTNHLAKITFTNNTAGSLTVKYDPGDPGTHSGFPIPDGTETIEQNNLYTEGSWSLVPTTLTSTNYALELSGTGFASAGTPDATVRIIKRPDGGGPWIANGSHVAGVAPIAKRSGLSGFSRFMLARPGQMPKISGNLYYYNIANTPLISGITIKLYQDGSQVGTDFNVTNGNYQFLNLQAGSYEIRASSSQSTAGSVNTSDAAQVNYWAVNPYTVEKVRFYSGDVTGSDHYINSTDAQRIQSHFVNGTAFDRNPWMFWKAGETTSSNDNPTASYPTVNVTTSNVTANIYGLCTGDFNRSFVPGAVRIGNDLRLVYRGEKFANPGEEINLPVTIANNSLVGSYSIILNFPSDLAEIQDVEMTSDEGYLSWAADSNELRISWYSFYPVYLTPDDFLFKIILKTKEKFSGGKIISFSLAENDLNEVADEIYERIDDAVLEIDQVHSSFEGITDPAFSPDFSLTCYPNPANEFIYIRYTLPYAGLVTIEMINSVGKKIVVFPDESQKTGFHLSKFNTRFFTSGIYIMKISLQTPTQQLQKTTKLLIKN